jgi:peptidoglycan lytic transglycosylase G
VKFLAVSLVVLMMLGAGAGAGVFFWGKSQYQSEGPMALEGEATIVLLPHGTGLKAIAAKLEHRGVISHAGVYEIAVRLQGDAMKLKAGEYAIPSGASMQTVTNILIAGRSILYKLTAAEGLTTAQILRVVEADPVLLGEVSLTPSEGALLPETYLFTRGASRDDVIRDMQEAMSDALEPLWNDRADELPFDSIEEAVILASIVEKETGIAEERPRIAAVFINRLNRGIRLQSDPTIIYGLTGGEPLGRGIRRSELDRKTDYNTYYINGLPPTPIANPGLDALKAVLNPPKTKELFFVADGTGGHVFASSNREHQRNVAKWRRVERERRSK